MREKKHRITKSCCYPYEQDLFPGIDCVQVTHPEFSAAVKHVLESENYVWLVEQVSLIWILNVCISFFFVGMQKVPLMYIKAISKCSDSGQLLFYHINYQQFGLFLSLYIYSICFLSVFFSFCLYSQFRFYR